MKEFKLKKDLPGVKKGQVYHFQDDKIPILTILIEDGEYFEEIIN